MALDEVSPVRLRSVSRYRTVSRIFERCKLRRRDRFLSSTEMYFDGLSAPRLTDLQRQILEHTEKRRVDLVVDAMVVDAVAQAGADDFGETDGFWDRVAA